MTIDFLADLFYNERILFIKEIFVKGGKKMLLKFILKIIAIVFDLIILVIEIIEEVHK